MSHTNPVVKFVANTAGRLIPDKAYLSIRYRLTFGNWMNWKKPETFNEKLQWLKIHDRNPQYVKMVDKVTAKQYVGEILGDQHIIPTIGVWDSVDEIDFDSLPNKYVLKCTHDSGSVLICKDMQHFDVEAAKNHLRKCLRVDQHAGGREWFYKDIKHRIIAEEYLEGAEGEDIYDYKLFCFNGKVKILKVDFDRFSNHRANYYSTDWELLPFGEKYYSPDPERKIPKPAQLLEMIECAEKLSEKIPFVRVDFYLAKGNVFFGEMTFYPACGFEHLEPIEWDKKLGSWINLG